LDSGGNPPKRKSLRRSWNWPCMSPTMLIGLASSKTVGCYRNTCLDLRHTVLISNSVNFIYPSFFKQISLWISSSTFIYLSVIFCRNFQSLKHKGLIFIFKDLISCILRFKNISNVIYYKNMVISEIKKNKADNLNFRNVLFNLFV